jgi:CheY-like chemotaxis protein
MHDPSSEVRVRAASDPGRARVLVVDDELRLREGIARFLREEYVVETAGSVLDALARLRSRSGFDVILSDVTMPDASGVDLYAAIVREFPSYAHRVIFMSGGLSEFHREGLAQLPNLCLDKPLDLPLLRALIRRIGARAPALVQTDG